MGCYDQIAQTGWLKQQTLPPPSSGGWKAVHGEGTGHCVPGESSLPGLRTAVFGLCPYVVERGSSGVSSSSSRGINPIKEALPSWPHLSPITSQGPQLRVSSHWGLFSIITVLHRVSMGGGHCPHLPGSFTSSNFFRGRWESCHHTQATMCPGTSARPSKGPPVWTHYLAIASPGFHALL